MAEGAVYGLLAVFAEGQEYVESFLAFVADKVIGRHSPILTESGPGEEGCGRHLVK